MTAGPLVITGSIKVVEAGRLIKDPSRVVWVPTWVREFQIPSTRGALVSTLRKAAVGGARQFADFNSRAHAK